MTQDIGVFIADDEDLARERIKRMLADLDGYSVVGEANNGAKALQEIARCQPEVALLDIRMPGMDGLELAQQLTRLSLPPAIIFCTAYDEYAIRAFQHQALGYLLKPARKEELAAALAQASRVTRLQIAAMAQQQEEATIFVAHSWQGHERIPLQDIFYFRADQKYLTVVHRNGETLSDQTLKELEERYADELIRVHRSTLINRHYIRALTRNSQGQYLVECHNGDTLPVSRRHVADIKHRLQAE